MTGRGAVGTPARKILANMAQRPSASCCAVVTIVLEVARASPLFVSRHSQPHIDILQSCRTGRRTLTFSVLVGNLEYENGHKGSSTCSHHWRLSVVLTDLHAGTVAKLTINTSNTSGKRLLDDRERCGNCHIAANGNLIDKGTDQVS
jgi:hypothetical protein